MSLERFEREWWRQKKEAEELPLYGQLGFDLIRGKPLFTRDIMDRFHFEIFGHDPFLRNMLQRMLEHDVGKRVSTIVIAPASAEGLLDEVNQVIACNRSKRKRSETLYYYSAENLESTFVKVPYSSFFDETDSKHLYAELNETDVLKGEDYLTRLEKAIGERFESEMLFGAFPPNPFIYIFYPGKLSQYPIFKFAAALSGKVSFRIFTAQTHFYDQDNAGMMYGPGLYSVDSYVKMQDQCYKAFKEKRKLIREGAYCGRLDDHEELNEAIRLAQNIDITQTAFVRFKCWYPPKRDFAWVYPVQQSLGKTKYKFKSSNTENKLKADIAARKPPKAAPSRLQIVEDLRPWD